MVKDLKRTGLENYDEEILARIWMNLSEGAQTVKKYVLHVNVQQRVSPTK